MLNPRLTAAIAAFHAADASIPHTADDAVMDAAVIKASVALDLARRIPALNLAEVAAKLELATSLVEWTYAQSRLLETAYRELGVVIWSSSHRAAA